MGRGHNIGSALEGKNLCRVSVDFPSPIKMGVFYLQLFQTQDSLKSDYGVGFGYRSCTASISVKTSSFRST